MACYPCLDPLHPKTIETPCASKTDETDKRQTKVLLFGKGSRTRAYNPQDQALFLSTLPPVVGGAVGAIASFAAAAAAAAALPLLEPVKEWNALLIVPFLERAVVGAAAAVVATGRALEAGATSFLAFAEVALGAGTGFLRAEWTIVVFALLLLELEVGRSCSPSSWAAEATWTGSGRFVVREAGRASFVVEPPGAVAGRAEAGAAGKRKAEGGGDFMWGGGDFSGDARDDGRELWDLGERMVTGSVVCCQVGMGLRVERVVAGEEEGMDEGGGIDEFVGGLGLRFFGMLTEVVGWEFSLSDMMG